MNRSAFLVSIVAFLFCTCSLATTPVDQSGISQGTSAAGLNISHPRYAIFGGTEETFRQLFNVSSLDLVKRNLINLERALQLTKNDSAERQEDLRLVEVSLKELEDQVAGSATYLPIKQIPDDVGYLFCYLEATASLLKRKNRASYQFYDKLSRDFFRLTQRAGRMVSGVTVRMLNDRPHVVGNSNILTLEGFVWSFLHLDRHMHKKYNENMRTMLRKLPRKYEADLATVEAMLDGMDEEGLPAAGAESFPHMAVGKSFADHFAYLEYLERRVIPSPHKDTRSRHKQFLFHLANEFVVLDFTQRHYLRLARSPGPRRPFGVMEFITIFPNEFYLVFWMLLESYATILLRLRDGNADRRVEYDQVMAELALWRTFFEGSSPRKGAIAPIREVKPGDWKDHVAFLDDINNNLVVTGSEMIDDGKDTEVKHNVVYNAHLREDVLRSAPEEEVEEWNGSLLNPLQERDPGLFVQLRPQDGSLLGQLQQLDTGLFDEEDTTASLPPIEDDEEE